MKKAIASQAAEMKTLDRIINRINSNDADYISELMSDAAGRQAYFASSIMQFTSALDSETSEDLLCLYLAVWGLFKHYPVCQDKAITRNQYERVQQRNISMFRYLDGEDDNKQFKQVVQNDHSRLSHGAVMQYISHCFQSWPSLKQMEMSDYTVQLIGMKSFIECFEEIAKE